MIAGVEGGGGLTMEGHKGTFRCLDYVVWSHSRMCLSERIDRMLQMGPSQEEVYEWLVNMGRGAQHRPSEGRHRFKPLGAMSYVAGGHVMRHNLFGHLCGILYELDSCVMIRQLPTEL